MTTIEEYALMRLRVELYGAAQLLKGDALEDLKRLVRELAMLLRLDDEFVAAATSALKAERDDAEARLVGVLDGTFSVGDGTAQAEIERLRSELKWIHDDGNVSSKVQRRIRDSLTTTLTTTTEP